MGVAVTKICSQLVRTFSAPNRARKDPHWVIWLFRLEIGWSRDWEMNLSRLCQESLFNRWVYITAGLKIPTTPPQKLSESGRRWSKHSILTKYQMGDRMMPFSRSKTTGKVVNVFWTSEAFAPPTKKNDHYIEICHHRREPSIYITSGLCWVHMVV